MAKILRKLQKIFGGSLTPSGNIAQFGSLANGAPAYSSDPDAIQTARYLQGWNGAIVGANSPALEDDNALNFLFSRQLAYLFQQGVAEYDAATEYHQNSICLSGGNLYQSITNTNVGNSVTDTNNWLLLLKPTTIQGAAQAKVVFDGTGSNGVNCVLASSFNVASVLKVSTGIYQINFASALPDANYAWCGVAGPKDGLTGGNDPLSGASPGVVTTSALRVRVSDPNTGTPTNSARISVIVF